jgi:hypothetical protein
MRVEIDGVVWHDAGGRIGFAFVDNLYVDPCDPGLGLRSPAVGPDVSDLVDALGTVPGWRVDGVTNGSFFGFEGSLVEVTGPADLAGCGDGESRLLHILGQPGYKPATSEREQSTLRIIDADGTRFVVFASVDADAPDEVRAELDTIIGSIVIVP